MSLNLNKIMLGGRLTRDPETRYTPKGTAVCEISIAINRKTEHREDVTFVEVTLWERKAEVVGQNFQKGDQILIEGVLRQERWEDKNTGKARSRLTVAAYQFWFIDPKSQTEAPQQQRQEQPAPQQQSLPSHESIDTQVNEGDDEIPF